MTGRANTPPRRGTRGHRVVVIALDGIIPFEFAIPARLFGAARDDAGRPFYEVLTAAANATPVRTTADFLINPGADLGAVRSADTIVLPAVELDEVVPDQVDAVVEALRSRRPGARVMSICTGAHLLATTGLLDGRPATTHWKHAAAFSRQFPLVRLDPDVLFIADGELLPSAGAAAGIDLCLHLIRSDHGSGVANAAARACVVAPWRDGGQAQFIEAPIPKSTDTSTAATRAWALDRLDTDLTLASMARHASMSVRTFTRRFRAEVGLSPNQWLSRQRVDHARRLLESTDLPVDQIADAAGLGTAASLRGHLRTTIGVSPSAYRRTFHPRAVATSRSNLEAQPAGMPAPAATGELRSH